MPAAPLAFFVELDALPALGKREVDGGVVSASDASTCDLIRAIFFTSNAMRKERDVWLHGHADRAIIRLTGATLRYVGPDERSILLLLAQARDVLATRAVAIPGTVTWLPSTPGIDVAAGLSPATAWAACLAAYPSRASLLPVFERGEGTGDILATIDGEWARAGFAAPAIITIPRPGTRPPAPVETYNTLRVHACNRDAPGSPVQVVLLNLLLDNLAGER